MKTTRKTEYIFDSKMSPLTIHVTCVSGSHVLFTCSGFKKRKGDIDVYSVERFKEASRDWLSEVPDGGFLVVDLDQISYVDSNGLGALTGTLKKLQERNATVRVVITDLSIKRIFNITGLNRIFDLFSTVEEAVAER